MARPDPGACLRIQRHAQAVAEVEEGQRRTAKMGVVSHVISRRAEPGAGWVVLSSRQRAQLPWGSETMTTGNKTMDLLGHGSDDDELPADLGPTAPVNYHDLTTSPSLLYSLTDRTVPQSVPHHETEKAKDFAEEIEDYRQQLEAEYKKFELSLAERDRTEPLDDMDWDDLEMQYRQEQFLLWMQVSREKETERAIKRLKTRVAFVQNSERQLVQKQDHFKKVLEAFQTAMSLLAHG
ncbi:hypothetical protein DV736_g2100, partial [Chaetothyriales sp. CBS 134916]